MNDGTLRSHPNPALRGLRFAEGVPGPNLMYRTFRRILHVGCAALWTPRVFNRHREPSRGGVVYISNHQSFLDPVLMSLALSRPMNYMARDTLFHVPGFRQLIQALNAFPVRRGTADRAALKEAMARVKAGGQVVIFAEGTRTTDGRINEFLPGVALLAQRTGAVTVPVVIDGAFECWPRTQMLPSPGQIVVQYGRPIGPEESAGMPASVLLTRVRREMIAIQADIRRRMGRPAIAYPDEPK
jgi:1-acyl-sn-glycerol-3-phosphate acyltransferase